MNIDKEDLWILAVFAAVIIAIIIATGSGVCFAALWSCNAQSRAYHEKGVEITPFEVFMGVKPAGTAAKK